MARRFWSAHENRLRSSVGVWVTHHHVGRRADIHRADERAPALYHLSANLAIPAAQQAILKAMPGAYFEKLAQEVVLKVFLAKMVLAIRTRLSEVSLFSQVAINDLTEDAFFKHLDDIDSAILLARSMVLQAVERAPRLVSPRDIRVDDHR
jgi:hypothetical protein